MSAGELVGYLASVLVVTSVSVKTMAPLRALAIVNNVAFIRYALLERLVPVLLLHPTLLPLNALRLHQIMSMVRDVRDAQVGDVLLESLLPFMTRRRFRAGETLFREGDAARDMFCVRQGAIRLPEIGKTVGHGDLLGEISMFSPDKRRTTTAVAESDGELLGLSDDDVARLYFQNPRFGFYIIRLITRRLIENAAWPDELGGVRVPVPIEPMQRPRVTGRHPPSRPRALRA